MSEEWIHSTPGFVPDVEDVERVFSRHHREFAETSGEVAYQQLQNEESIRRQYSGRVLFELLQNALDRAESTVQVQIRPTELAECDNALVVANDGEPVRVDPEYDYGTPPEVGGGRRPDFNALCSLHTSNKLPDESVGNKGIGFRSVFWLGDFVRVWSMFDRSSGWWGLEMHSPLDRDRWEQRVEVSELRRGRDAFLEDSGIPIGDDERRPSFHFPLPLESTEIPSAATLEDATTAVVVPIRPERERRLRESIDQIRESHLDFVGLFEDRRDLTVHIETPEERFSRGTWPGSDHGGEDSTLSMSHWATEELRGLAVEAEHDVSEPGAAIGWPERHGRFGPGDDQTAARIYAYLPTLVDGPFGVDIQGDFQLRTDRTGLRVDEDVTGPYNRALLKLAAELHLLEVFRNVGLPLETVSWELVNPKGVQRVNAERSTNLRPDLWCFLDPSHAESAEAEVVIEHVRSLLFGDADRQDPARYELWARLSETYFDGRTEWSPATYRSFWNASKGWIDRFSPFSSSAMNWREAAAALCDALRERDAAVAPVASSEETGTDVTVSAVTLPERGERLGLGGHAERHSKALFLREGDDRSLELPDALREANRAVTAFNFPSGFDGHSPQPLGAQRFSRWDVLEELRQLPNSLRNWSHEPLAEDPERAADLQRGLLRFAAELYRLETGGQGVVPAESDRFEPGWRVREVDPYTRGARRAGRSLATLYLPTIGGAWEPARQLTADRVDRDRLGPLSEEVDVDEFLLFLGVTPAPPEDGVPITFLEGGSDGRVPARDVPPALTRPGQGSWANPTLGRLPGRDDETDPHAWRRSIRDAWEDWLAPLVEDERAARADEEEVPVTNLFEPLAERSWYPVDEGADSADAPHVVDNPPERVAPRELTLLPKQQQQFPSVLYDVASDSPDRGLLETLGAIDGIDTDELGRDNANPAFRLLDQLHSHELPRIRENPTARQATVSLFDRLLNAVVREGDPESPPSRWQLLTFDPVHESRALEDRPLSWCDPQNETAWIARDNTDRDRMRRFFPETRLVAATVRPQPLDAYAPLADRGIEIEARVHPEHTERDESTLARKLEEQLDSAVPKLLALAEAGHHVDVNAVDAANRWQQGTFRHVEDAWIEFRAQLGEDETLTEPLWRGAYDNALYLGDEPPTVVFDTPPDIERLPPLDEFGEPVAELLLGDGKRGVGPLFARALGVVDSEDPERIDRLLEKHDAVSLVEAYERHLRQLEPEELESLHDDVVDALEGVGLELQRSADQLVGLTYLGPDDVEISPGASELTSRDVNTALEAIDLSPAREPFKPKFSCRDHNRSEWRTWFDRWEDRVVPYLTDTIRSSGIEDVDEDDVTDRLQTFVVEEECSKVSFDPSAAVTRWLHQTALPEAEIPDPDELEERVREFSPLYEDVQSVETSTDVGWSRPKLDEATPVEGETGTVDPAEVAETMEARGAVGREAERAALSHVAETTAECLRVARERGEYDRVWSELAATIPSGGSTEESLVEARLRWEETGEIEDLEAGLHVASVWDGAGYDLLGLEQGDGESVTPTRYEVKGLPSGDGVAKVHLTTNELAVYREVTRSEPAEPSRYYGAWKLLGVKPDGSAVDLTRELEDLQEPLSELRTEGFDHDGVVLYVGGRV